MPALGIARVLEEANVGRDLWRKIIAEVEVGYRAASLPVSSIPVPRAETIEFWRDHISHSLAEVGLEPKPVPGVTDGAPGPGYYMDVKRFISLNIRKRGWKSNIVNGSYMINHLCLQPDGTPTGNTSTLALRASDLTPSYNGAAKPDN